MIKRMLCFSPVIGDIIKYFSFILFTYSLLTSVSYAENVPYWSWAQSAQILSSYGEAEFVESDALGNCYVAGVFSGTINIGGTVLVCDGSNDIFITKLSPQGDFLWAVRAGGSSYETINELAVDVSGNCYIIGSFEGTTSFGATTLVSSGVTDAYISKLDDLGNFEWTIKAGGLDFDVGTGIAVDVSGNCYITGTFHGTSTWGNYSFTSTGQDDLVVAKISNLGIFQWAVRSEGDSWHYVSQIKVKVDPSGNCLISGNFYMTLSLSGYVIHSEDGQFFIAKLNTDGVFQLVEQTQIYGYSSGGTCCIDMEIDSSGNCMIILKEQLQWDEYSYDYYSLYILHNDLSSDNYLCDAGIVPEGVGIDSLGNCYITGRFSGAVNIGSTNLVSNGTNDVFVCKFSSPVNGEYEFALQAGGSGRDYATDIKLDNCGNCFIIGVSSGTANFGTSIIGNIGSSSMFIAKLQCVETIPQPNVYISSDAELVSLSWNSIPGAITYNVYKCNDLSEPFELVSSTSQLSYSITPEEQHAFFRVVAASGRVESDPSTTMGYLRYDLVQGQNCIAIPFVQDYSTISEFGAQFGDTVSSISIWDSTTQSWNSSVNYGDGLWDPDLPLSTGMVLFINKTNSSSYYCVGALPASHAQYNFVTGDNTVMIPLNKANLTDTAIAGMTMGNGEAVNTISIWNPIIQGWESSVNYGNGYWDRIFETSIGIPMFINSIAVETWPIGPRMSDGNDSSMQKVEK